MLLDLDSTRWSQLHHVYGTAEDIPPLIRQIEGLPIIVWDGDGPLEAIASAIYHQGDPNSASYAAVPHLIKIASERPLAERIHLLLLSSWIEAARYLKPTPIPDDLSAGYSEAIKIAGVLAKEVLLMSDRSWVQGDFSDDLIYLFAAIAAFEGEWELALELNDFDLLRDAFREVNGDQ